MTLKALVFSKARREEEKDERGARGGLRGTPTSSPTSQRYLPRAGRDCKPDRRFIFPDPVLDFPPEVIQEVRRIGRDRNVKLALVDSHGQPSHAESRR